MRFDMGAQTLATLANETDASHQDLGSLVRAFMAAAQPLERVFQGQGRVAFDNFKDHTDEIANDLNTSLSRILGGQRGMDTAFQTGDVEMSDNAARSQSSANFAGARFGASR